jgi:hypothetical protein
LSVRDVHALNRLATARFYEWTLDLQVRPREAVMRDRPGLSFSLRFYVVWVDPILWLEPHGTE